MAVFSLTPAQVDYPAFTADGNWGPEWARRAVWYQIFPERFRNGDRGNDPALSDLAGAYPHDVHSPWQIHPWGADWYELQPYEKKNGHSIWFNLQRRRYGGDVAGILEKLDYLQNLGVTALYLNPVFAAPSSHKYDGATYHHIDPHFGPDPQGDRALIAGEDPADPATWRWSSADRLMLQLIDQVHQRGMHLIFDGVFNHMGITSWAFQDVVKQRQASAYKDWFTITSWDHKSRHAPFTYEGWFGVSELPELREDEGGLVEGPRDYIYAATRRWMDPDGDGDPRDGIDGWRLDVAFCVAHPFWKAWRQQVLSINPQAYLTAEVIDTPEVLKPYLLGDEFDAVMNYQFAFACHDLFMRKKNRITISAFERQLRLVREAFPPGVAPVMQNLLDSHDTMRLASLIVNGDLGAFREWGAFFELSKGSHPDVQMRKPDAEELQTLRLITLFQMTYVGAPMIYYGDEVGMTGANDPCCRKPMLWEDIRHEPERMSPQGVPFPQAIAISPDMDLHDHYRKLIRVRRDHPALWRGAYRTLLCDDSRQLFCFERFTDQERLLILLNGDAKAHAIRLDHAAGAALDLLSGERFDAGGDAAEILLPGRWGRILQVSTHP